MYINKRTKNSDFLNQLFYFWAEMFSISSLIIPDQHTEIWQCSVYVWFSGQFTLKVKYNNTSILNFHLGVLIQD